MSDSTRQVKQIARGVVYRLLSVCFFQPEAETRQILINLKVQIAGHFPEYLTCSAELLDAFGTTSGELSERKIEYAQLFVTSIGKTVLPYGSIYLEGGRKMMGESTMAVQRFYDRFHLDVKAMEVADHLAIELEFMQYLSCAEPENEEMHKALEEFRQTLVAPWLQPFADAVEAAGSSRFYALLARLTADIVAPD
ncbi:MAG: molecular chaperone [Desulfopila sp.]